MKISDLKVQKKVLGLAFLIAVSGGYLDINTAQARGLIAAHAGRANVEVDFGKEKARALLPMGRLQGGGFGYYGLNPYFNKDDPLKKLKIFKMQKNYINDWNHSLSRPQDQKPGYKSGYEANGGHQLVKMYKKILNGNFRNPAGSIKMMPKKPAPVFKKVLNNVEHHPNRTVKVKSPEEVIKKMKARKRMRNNDKIRKK